MPGRRWWWPSHSSAPGQAHERPGATRCGIGAGALVGGVAGQPDRCVCPDCTGGAAAKPCRRGQLAQAGLEYALYRQSQPALPGQPAWISDGRSYPWQFAGAQLELRVLSESAKVDINQADAGLLAALMQQLGAGQAQAQQLAAAG